MRARAVASEQRCIVVDRRCRESEGKAKIEGYVSVSDEEAHHRLVFFNCIRPNNNIIDVAVAYFSNKAP